MTYLRNCPFCGSPVEMELLYDSESEESDSVSRIKCKNYQNCDAEMTAWTKNIVKEWNRRVRR